MLNPERLRLLLLLQTHLEQSKYDLLPDGQDFLSALVNLVDAIRDRRPMHIRLTHGNLNDREQSIARFILAHCK